jgi:DsbC/DsbD-like thiol-disulfide interchange protein
MGAALLPAAHASSVRLLARAAVAACLALALPLPAAPRASAESSPWVESYNSRARLLAGVVEAGGRRLVAGVEIRMAPGWKTYWRMPGDSGGVPPHLDWTGSANLAASELHFPAPGRLKDASGDAIGYKDSVVLPIEITASDPAKPVELRLALEYGICREICVPAEAKLALTVPPLARAAPEPALVAALAKVPRKAEQRRPGDPRLASLEAELTGEKPRLTLTAEFPGGTAGADVYVEAPDGIYVPMARRIEGGSGAALRFEIDLKDGVDPKDLAGKLVTITMVSDAGASEATARID